jgi:hypothetical protein
MLGYLSKRLVKPWKDESGIARISEEDVRELQ